MILLYDSIASSSVLVADIERLAFFAHSARAGQHPATIPSLQCDIFANLPHIGQQYDLTILLHLLEKDCLTR